MDTQAKKNSSKLETQIFDLSPKRQNKLNIMFADSNKKSVMRDNHSASRDRQENFANLSAIKLT